MHGPVIARRVLRENVARYGSDEEQRSMQWLLLRRECAYWGQHQCKRQGHGPIWLVKQPDCRPEWFQLVADAGVVEMRTTVFPSSNGSAVIGLSIGHECGYAMKRTASDIIHTVSAFVSTTQYSSTAYLFCYNLVRLLHSSNDAHHRISDTGVCTTRSCTQTGWLDKLQPHN